MADNNGSGKRKFQELTQNSGQQMYLNQGSSDQNETVKKPHVQQVLTYKALLLIAQFADDCEISETRGTEDRVVNDDEQLQFSVLTYNIWFENIEMAARINSIIRIIIEEGYPDVIMLQEVVAESYSILERNSLLRYLYNFSAPPGYSYFTVILVKKKIIRGQVVSIGNMEYANSQMGRGVLFCSLDLSGTRICFGTTHLESVFGQPYSNKKVKGDQFQQAMECLKEEGPNILLCGDFNWDDKKEGKLEYEGVGVQDVWLQLHPTRPGYTYDGQINKMISRFQNRLDRMFYSIKDVEAVECKIVGKHPIPNVSTFKQFKNRQIEVPVYPSDHFGLLAKFKSKKKLKEEDSSEMEE